MEWKISYKEEGRVEGLTKGKVDAICMYLEAKFGESSKDLQDKVSQIKDLSVLDETIIQLYTTDELHTAVNIVQHALKKQK